MHEFSSPETLLDVDFARPVYVVVDRLSINSESRSRLVDSIEICYREGHGEALLEFVADSSGIAERAALQRAIRMQSGWHAVSGAGSRGCFRLIIRTGRGPRCQGFGNTI